MCAAVTTGSDKKAERVQVVVRCRPMNEAEVAGNYQRTIAMDVRRGEVTLTNPKARGQPPRQFTFDSVYDWNSKQRDLYDETFAPLVDSVLQGYNGTIFAYGQTGTGKTYTMEGNADNPEDYGVLPNAFHHIFNHINRSHDEQYLVRASYLEIYQEEIRDLLCKNHDMRLELKERTDTGVYVKDLKAFVAKNAQEIEKAMRVGNKNRAVGRTDMNTHSSRSHAIFMITVECSKIGEDGDNHIRVGKLNLVDLAGSERQSKTGATGKRFQEAIKINLSLSALGNVISALVAGRSSHIPYRDSKLTRLLQDSLGGNARTVMVATIGPADYNYDETWTTLQYADRAKAIKNKPKINEDPKDALIREFQDEIKKLENELSKRGKKSRRRRKEKRAGGGEGDEGGDEEDDEVNGEDGAVSSDPFKSIKEQQLQLEAEKTALLENQTMIAEEKDKLMAEMQKRSKQLHKEQEATKRLTETIKAMQGKLLVGGKGIHDHTKDQEEALEKQRRMLAEQKRQEREMQQTLEKREESTAEVKETFDSLTQEVEAKTRKLRKLFSKLEAAQQEIEDLQEQFANERQSFIQTQEELLREIQRRAIIIENFIPCDVKDRIVSRAVFDEELSEWTLTPVEKDTASTRITQPVLGQRSRGSAKTSSTIPGNSRVRPENIMQVELDMPSATTREYEGPSVAPRVQAALDAALEEEEEIVIDAALITTASKPGRIGKSSKTKRKKEQVPIASRPPPNPAKEFPTSRGLVGKQRRA